MADPRHRIDQHCLGWLESPTAASIRTDSVLVAGWVFSSNDRIQSVFIRVRGEDFQAAYGLPRPDVAKVYPGEPHAGTSGFSGLVKLDGRRRPRAFEVWGRFESGRTQRLFHHRVAVFSSGAESLRRGYRGLTRLFRAPNQSSVAMPADLFRQARETELRVFLASGAQLDLRSSEPTVVSVVVVTWNRPELTFACLRALRQSTIGLEFIIVDNGSTDSAVELLRRIQSATIIKNGSNVGFTVAANQGAARATGRFLLFVNNDAEVLPGAVEQLVRCAASDERIGAVGGKLIWPSGRLQEAGSIIWNDGSCDGYGRGGDPASPEFAFRRDVDFCSGALLLTSRELFSRLGGFEERFKPAYYEDADYCVRLWKAGLRVVFEPAAVAIHHEFGTSGRPEAERLQVERRVTFCDIHRDWLQDQSPRGLARPPARHPHGKKSLLYIDDIIPDRRRGSGFPRSAVLLSALESLGFAVTAFSMQAGQERLPDFTTIEQISQVGYEGLAPFLASRRGQYSAVIVSRPHNVRLLKAVAGMAFDNIGCPVIYDAEAIFAARDVMRQRLLERQITAEQEAESIRQEIQLAHGCAVVLTVNDIERERFCEAGLKNVATVSHSVEAVPDTTEFENRDSVLFVGAFSSGGPNEDAAEFLIRSVRPQLTPRLAADVRFVVAGSGVSALNLSRDTPGIEFLSDLPDLNPQYGQARVFVAPTRFAAGIPIKVIEAAAKGVPVVATPLLATQLGWQADRHLLVATTAEQFADQIGRLFDDRSLWKCVREAALDRIRAEYNPAVFTSSVAQALSAAGVSA